MTEDAREKYSEALREGRLEDATELAQELSDRQVETEQSEDSDFTELKGVGDELADDLNRLYEDLDDLADASVEELSEISGVGDILAENLLDQVN
jgi:excinuclease UvrABC nuclease subunit